MKKIQKKLNKIDWLSEKKEIDAINEFYGEAIYEINEFVKTDNFHFDNIEADVHELRRKLRWLSIYPQALLGSIQVSKNKSFPKKLQKYLTKEITSSPFNKMPDANDNTYFLLLEQNYFYSLSWMIAELGKIKDKGLLVVAVKEALLETTKLSDIDAVKKAHSLLGSKQPKIDQLLEEAASICKLYFDEQNLENLVVGIRSVK